MKKRNTAVGLLAFAILFLAGGAVWLASMQIPAPQEQKEIVLDPTKYIQ